MSNILEKLEAHRLVDQLPQNASWDDLIHEIYVRETIQSGLNESIAGQTKDVFDIRSHYGLSK